MNDSKKLGAKYLGDGKTEFWIFAPYAKQAAIHFVSPQEQRFVLTPQGRGYHHGIVENIKPGSRYLIAFNGQEYADPASNYQPDGVYGPSEVIDHSYNWSENEKSWQGLPLPHYIIYELHVGTYTKEGTFLAIIPTLDDLCKLGITAIELMPIAQFCGNRNWGYDGVFPFAPQNSYGTCEDLKKLIDSCHQKGIAVILDVIYNHLGPEGNILANFGPYFTDRYHTPWGSAINFDGPYSDAVRYYFLQNALMWVRDYHIDAMRLDALHTIFDYSAYHFLAELSDHVHRYGHQSNRHIFLIAESSLNDTKIIRPHQSGGYALDAQWNDDFHHALHAYITGEHDGYYQDFGEMRHLIKAFTEGYVLTGQYSEYWQCRHGQSSQGTTGDKFVVFSQNHDHVGNRANGERLSQLISFAQTKMIAALVLLSPFVPLLFMGEEYGETAPFLYFTSHINPTLINAVWEGRKAETALHYPNSQTPNPQDEETYNKSKINKILRVEGEHAALYEFYRELIRLRKTIPALMHLNKQQLRSDSSPKRGILFLHRWHQDSHLLIIFNFSSVEQNADIPSYKKSWQKVLDSDDDKWQGQGNLLPDQLDFHHSTQQIKLQPYSVAIYTNIVEEK